MNKVKQNKVKIIYLNINKGSKVNKHPFLPAPPPPQLWERNKDSGPLLLKSKIWEKSTTVQCELPKVLEFGKNRFNVNSISGYILLDDTL